MAKAINWPKQFRDEIIAEDSEHERIALRLGTLYYENQYWVPDEIVDIRVNHLKIRKGKVTRELRQCMIQDLTRDDYVRLKKTLQNVEAIIQFLSETYQQPVQADSFITLVAYQNLPIVPEDMETQDDPHM